MKSMLSSGFSNPSSAAATNSWGAFRVLASAFAEGFADFFERFGPVWERSHQHHHPAPPRTSDGERTYLDGAAEGQR